MTDSLVIYNATAYSVAEGITQGAIYVAKEGFRIDLIRMNGVSFIALCEQLGKVYTDEKQIALWTKILMPDGSVESIPVEADAGMEPYTAEYFVMNVVEFYAVGRVRLSS
jgi:hypothetical protein